MPQDTRLLYKEPTGTLQSSENSREETNKITLLQSKRVRAGSLALVD